MREPVRGHLAFGLLVLVGLALVFPGITLRGEILFERDLQQMLYGQYASLARIVRSGGWPIWDPWPGFGQPLLANPAAQVLYPPTWLCLALEPGRAYVVYVFIHLAVGALATRALARRLGASDLAAAAAALLWMLSGPILSLANLWHHLAGACLMPVVWLAASKVRRQAGLRDAILLGGAVGLQLLAGSFDLSVLTLVVTGGWWLLASREGSPTAPPPLRRLLLPIAVAGGVATALAAGLLVPLFELWRGSARAALGEAMRTQWSLHPAQLLQVSLPLMVHRLPLTPDARGQLFDGREPFLASVYLGLAAVPLVAAALLPRPRRLAVFLIGAIGVAALVALGRHGFLYPALVDALPPLRSLRYPSKAAAVLPLLWALLAALGLDAIRDRTRSEKSHRPALALCSAAVAAATAAAAILFLAPPTWLVPLGSSSGPEASAAVHDAVRGLLAAAGLGAIVLGLLRWDRSWALRGPALVGLAAIDLCLAHRTLNETAPAHLFAAPPAILSHLPAGDDDPRLHTWDYLGRVLGKAYRRMTPRIPAPGAPRDVSPTLAAVLARRDFLSPPIAAEFALRGSFDRDWLGLQPRGVRNLGLIFQAQEETPGALRLLQVGGVSYVVALHLEGLEPLSPVATEQSPFAGAVHLLRVPDPLPRAYAVGGTRVADGIEALRLLIDERFDPRAEVLFPDGRDSSTPASFAADVRPIEVRADRIALAVDLSDEGHIVLLEAWDGAWRAFVDGTETIVRRGNVGFVAVAVPRGAHRVEVVYRPRGLGVGLAATTSAALLVLGSLVWAPRASGVTGTRPEQPGTTGASRA